MRLVLSIMLLLGLAMSSASAGTTVPPEMKDWMQRYQQCEHWAEEEGDGDAARQEQIKNGVKKSDCASLQSDLKTLYVKYACTPKSTDEFCTH